MKTKIAGIVAGALVLGLSVVGCVGENAPSRPTDTASAADGTRKIESTRALEEARPYTVAGEGKLANEDPSRSARLWFITAPEADSYEEYVQTAIQAVLDLRAFYGDTFTAVILVPEEDAKTSYADAFYAADGKGALGMTGSVPAVPMYWKVRAMDDRPYESQELAVIRLWQAKQSDFPSQDPLSSLSYDEKGLREYISDALDIPYSQTLVRSLEIKDYNLDASFGVEPEGQLLQGTPQSEAVLETLNDPVDFSVAEKARADDLISKLPGDVGPEFDRLYEAAEKVSKDRRWWVYSSYRPYVQSSEYQQLLQFCREEGQSVWPLLFPKLDTESRGFAGGLIVDATTPEYLYFFDRAVYDGQPGDSTSPGAKPMASGAMVKYAESLLGLLAD